jgi:hypothetical protein
MIELTNQDLYDIMRDRAARNGRKTAAACCRVRGLVTRFLAAEEGADWPAGDSDIAANARLALWIAEFNAQAARVRNMVLPGQLPAGRDGRQANTHGEREAAGRQRDDVRPLADEQPGPSSTTRWAHCNREACADWQNHQSCLDRQRAGACPALAGCNRGPEPGGDARPGGARWIEGGPR